MRPITGRKVGFDIDDTITDSRPIIQAFFRHLKAIRVKHDPQIYYDTHCIHSALFGANSNAHFERFYATGKAPLPNVMPGARFGLHLIRKHYDVPFITSRSDVTVSRILSHLQTLVFPGCHMDQITRCRGLPKREAVEKLGLTYFVENSVAEIEHLLGIKGTKIIQYPCFLNGKCPVVDHPDVIRLRACNWVDIGVSEKRIFHNAWHEIQWLLLGEEPSKHRAEKSAKAKPARRR